MPKGSESVEIVEGSTKLMDPAGEEFQKMLTAAKTAAVDKLASKDDTSMVEGDPSKGVKETPSVSPAEDKDEEDKDTKDEPEDLKEIPGDDIGNLKNKVSGLQAELTRVRKQKSGSAEEAQELKERIADMEGQLKVLRESKREVTLEDKLAKLTDKQVISNRRMWEDELIDARVEARQAAKDSDVDSVRQANERIANANLMLEKYDEEKDRRASAKVTGKTDQDKEKEGIANELSSLFEDISKAAPDIFKKDTPIWKAGQEEYTKLPSLMRQLGPLGELVAAASAIAKHPELVGKKVADKVIDKMVKNIEDVADKAFNKGGTAPSAGTVPYTTTINTQADLQSFEAQVRAIKGG